MVSSTVGSPTMTGWKRRSSAASFSMCFAVLVERGGADGVQLAARQHRLEHVGGVHRAFGGARADDRVQLVDEEDDLPGESTTSLSTAFSRSSNSPRYFAPATSAPMSSATIFLFFRPSGTSCADDALRQPFDDGGLADAGLADEHRVVLGAARQHLDHAADLVVAADDRIELALARELGQVAAVALERLVGRFRILARHALRAADARHRLQDRVLA